MQIIVGMAVTRLANLISVARPLVTHYKLGNIWGCSNSCLVIIVEIGAIL